MTRRVDNIDAHAVPLDAGTFGENGDAAFAFQIVGIHHAFGLGLIVPVDSALAEHRVN